MARVSFFDDFFGKGSTANANLFDAKICPSGSSGKVEVLNSDTADLNGAGFLQILPYGQSGSLAECGNGPAYCAAILTSPEIKAKRLPIVGGRVLFRDPSMDKMQVIVGFITAGQNGPVASDMVGFRLTNNTNESNAFKALFKKGGQVSVEADTGVKPKEFQPITLEVELTPDMAVYRIDGEVVYVWQEAAPTSALNFGVIVAINHETSVDRFREMLVDYAYGSLER